MISSGPGSIFRNKLLAALPSAETDALRPHLVKMPLLASQVLYERNHRVTDLFFLETGIVLLTAETAEGARVGVGLIGPEGLVGISAILNPEAVAGIRVFVQVQGDAYRIGSNMLREIISRLPWLQDRCLRQIELMMLEMAQISACNARHALPDRLASWLLMLQDRMDSDDLPVTHEFLALALGVRRAGISAAAAALQAQGLVRQLRGRISVLDRPALAAASCRCQQLIEQNQLQVFGAAERRGFPLDSSRFAS